jgi:PAS domain S-box-containing protein
MTQSGLPGRISDPLELQASFIEEISPLEHFNRLFDHFDDICLFAKNRIGQILVANRRLLRLYGFEKEADMIGKTDFDLLPHRLAEKYRRDDLSVMDSGKPLINIVELFLNQQGIPGWFLTTKLPARNRAGETIGIIGTIRPFEGHASATPGDKHMEQAMDYMRQHVAEAISIRQLADMAQLSLRQFERRFKNYFNTTPQQFLIKMRIHTACELLRAHGHSLGHIALITGFYDQSSFTRHFKSIMGMTPLQYRKQYR